MPVRKRTKGNATDSTDSSLRPQSSTSTVPTPSQRSAFDFKRVITRLIIVGCTIMASRYFLGPSKEVTFASASEEYDKKTSFFKCSKDYDREKEIFKGCAPTKCGRVVMDNIITTFEVQHLLRIAKNGFALGGATGGASILDLHSGALSKGEKFINIYKIMDESDPVFTQDDFNVYRQVKNKIHISIAREFGIPPELLYLTKPTFFSRITSKPSKTLHDQYWHAHVDKETYGSFDYTSLLYLTTFEEDFMGGRFIFRDKVNNKTVEPRAGRVSFFTSGSENLHSVELVEGGTRYAITVSFTCDKEKAITDPVIQK